MSSQHPIPMATEKASPVAAALRSRSAAEIQLVAILLALGLGYVDYLTGFELRIDVFYLLPVSIAIWYVGGRAGLSLSALSALLIFVTDLFGKTPRIVRFIDLWNILIILCFFVLFTLALSRLRTALDAQRRLSAELNSALVDVRKINGSLEAFSYSVSHDLKGPLWHVSGFAEMLAEHYGPRLDDAGRNYISRIIANTQRMRAYIDALLALSRYPETELVRSPIDLTAMIRGIFAEYEGSGDGRGRELIVADQMTARGDPTLVQVVLHNLIDNAWKFTQHRPVVRIELGVAKVHDEAVYFIRDNGAGMKMENAARIFSPFKRMHQESEFPGYGIGLATVQRIVHHHGGRIWVESEPDAGTTFYFTLG